MNGSQQASKVLDVALFSRSSLWRQFLQIKKIRVCHPASPFCKLRILLQYVHSNYNKINQKKVKNNQFNPLKTILGRPLTMGVQLNVVIEDVFLVSDMFCRWWWEMKMEERQEE